MTNASPYDGQIAPMPRSARSATSNNPLHGVNARTPLGRRVRDLAEAIVAQLAPGSTSDLLLMAQTRKAAELVVRSEVIEGGMALSRSM
jgi:hypothetical protein